MFVHSLRPALPAALALALAAHRCAAQEHRATPEPAAPPLPRESDHHHGPDLLRLVDLSFNIQSALGTSTARDAQLESLQGGGHDPRKRGFTFQNAELGLGAAVDDCLELRAHLIAFLDAYDGETVVELEEAFVTTMGLPAGLQLKAGSYFTEVGRINPVHPHAWDWQDQPVVNTRFFGPDGMRGPGARLRWRPTNSPAWEVMAGAHNASGEAMHSFVANEEAYGERPIGGRFFAGQEFHSLGDLAWFARLATTCDAAPDHSFGIGTSAIFGPNATGADADTLIYGADFLWRWRPHSAEHGWPFFKLQGEVLARRFDAAPQVDPNDRNDPADDVLLPGRTLDDLGCYLFAFAGFAPGWAAGLRAEWAGGSGASYDAATDAFARRSDPFRADRFRLSPLLAWHPSDFARVRLQYNYDDSDHLADVAHSAWLGVDVLVGKHPGHQH